MLKKSTSWTVLIYGILIGAFGYWGYHQTESLMSLYSGVGFGALLVLSALFMFCNLRWASYLALILTTLLTILFSVRYSMTGKSVPAGFAVFSAGMLLFLLARTTKWKR